MYCPKCHHANPADADRCAKCKHDTGYLRQRVFVGRQFIFVQADEQHPLALKVDDAVQTYTTAAILSRHQHAVSFGDTEVGRCAKRPNIANRPDSPNRPDAANRWPLPDQPQLPKPTLAMLTVITDRKIYQPETEAHIFIAGAIRESPLRESPLLRELPLREPAQLEIKLAGQKVYEAKVELNQDGLALHPYPDLKEGEYSVQVTLSDNLQAECSFSVAQFTLSPLIATLKEHSYAEHRLKFALSLLLLSVPYSGELEFGLQCQVCGERVVATQKARAKDGLANGDFDLSGHGGPFHVQITTPDGNTALVSFPGTGAVEREHIRINPLGQQYDAGLLPWEEAQAVRGFYIGAGATNMTPLMLEEVIAESGKLKAATDLSLAQVLAFDPRSGHSQTVDLADLKRNDVIEFQTSAPYTLFTVGAFTKDKPFEGWGIIVKPVAFEAQIKAPKTAQPGEEVNIHLSISPRPSLGEGMPVPRPQGVGGVRADPPQPFPLEGGREGFCLLLVYDARLEHESPVPRLAKRIYESARDATTNLAAGQVENALEQKLGVPDDILYKSGRVRGAMLSFAAMPQRDMMRALSPDAAPLGAGFAMAEEAEAMPTTVQAPTMVVAPTRMEFPELAYIELFYLEGEASRTVRLGDQIGTWRARAYVFKGADYRELTADIQADKPLYAELDLPAIASVGDDITAAVNYYTREPADLVITSLFGETRRQVQGAGVQPLAIKGPGRVEVRIENPAGSDWSARDVAPPGAQKVTASRLMILDKGQSVQGEKVVIYASLGQVLKDTITALIHYPFG